MMAPTARSMTSVTLLVYAALMMAVAADPLGWYFSVEPEWLADYCVADRTSHIWVDGHVKCKNQTHVRVQDFLYSGMNHTGDTNNTDGSTVRPVLVAQLASLNGLNLGLARIDLAVGGVVVPHLHPRASEAVIIQQGTLYVGFVNSTNHLFATTVNEGDVFVFPKGLIHFLQNIGNTPAIVYAAFSSQNPGITEVGRNLFGPYPFISDEVLMKGLKISQHNVQFCEKQFNTTEG